MFNHAHCLPLALGGPVRGVEHEAAAQARGAGVAAGGARVAARVAPRDVRAARRRLRRRHRRQARRRAGAARPGQAARGRRRALEHAGKLTQTHSITLQHT